MALTGCPRGGVGRFAEKVKAGMLEAKESDNEDLKKEATWAVDCIERTAGKLN